MKKKILVAMAVLLLSGTAYADDFICGGNNCQDITVASSADFEGFGGGMFTGDEGRIEVEKSGMGLADLNLNLSGATCGLNCKDGTFGLVATAMESISVLGTAFGTQTGQTVSVVDEGGVFSRIDFIFDRTTVGVGE